MFRTLYRRQHKKDFSGALPWFLSEPAFEKAFQATACDVGFLAARRSLVDGISEPRVMGALAFRLARSKIVQFTDPQIVSLPGIADLQTRSAIGTVFQLLELDAFLRPQEVEARTGFADKRLKEFRRPLREIVYLLEDRHTNQESVTLCLDSLMSTKMLLDTFCPVPSLLPAE